MKSNMTAHARFDRANRIEKILDTVGFGETWVEAKGKRDGRDRYERLTTTGVLVVLGEDKKTIITAYIPSAAKAKNVYKDATGLQSMPRNKFCMFVNNEKKFKGLML